MTSAPTPSILILNSNVWFSAVSDFSLQIALACKPWGVWYGAQRGYTAMENKCQEHGIPFIETRLRNTKPWSIFSNLLHLYKLISSARPTLTHVYTFEGREQTLCALLRILTPWIWKETKLIRVRAQAQNVRNSWLSRLLYRRLTHHTFWAADCVKRRVPFEVHNASLLFYFKALPPLKPTPPSSLPGEHLPAFDPRSTHFVILGRLDPVKGHALLFDAFLKAQYPLQISVVGQSANLTPDHFLKNLTPFASKVTQEASCYCLEFPQNKRLYFFNKAVPDLHNLWPAVHFGVITSLDSEVVCRVAVEFLQQKIPVIASRVGALPEVLFEFPSWLFEAGNIAELSKKLEKAHHLVQDDPVSYNVLKNQAYCAGLRYLASPRLVAKLTDGTEDFQVGAL